MAQEFNCKEPGCDKKVVFEYEPVSGLYKLEIAQPMELEEVAYLTCENGHTHAYKVKVPKRR